MSVRGVDLAEGTHFRRGTVFKAVTGKVRIAITEICTRIRGPNVLYHCVIIVLYHVTWYLPVALCKDNTIDTYCLCK